MNTRSFIKSITLLPALLAGAQAAPTDQVVWRALPRKWGKWMHATGNRMPNVCHIGFNFYNPCSYVDFKTKAPTLFVNNARGVKADDWNYLVSVLHREGSRVTLAFYEPRPLIFFQLTAPSEYVWKQGDIQILEPL